MNLISSIASLYGADMLHAIALRAGAFWLAQVLLTGVLVAVWTADRLGPRIWK